MKRLFNIFLVAAMLAVTITTISIPTSTAHAAPLLSTLNAWNAIGSGLNGPVYAIAISGTDIYVGGNFTNAGGDPNADRIAKWDGSSWSALGSGISNGQVNALAFSGSNLYVGGSFTSAGGVLGADHIALWNGSAWSAVNNGLPGTVNAIGVNGLNVYIGGDFTNAGGDDNADYIVKVDGGDWGTLGSIPLNAPVYSIAVAIGSSVYVGGAFANVNGNSDFNGVAQWDGSSWSPLGDSLGDGDIVYSLLIMDGDLYVGGLFGGAGYVPGTDKIAKWDGSSWSALNSGLNGTVRALAASGSNLYVGGDFTDAGSITKADYITKWDGSSWYALGSTSLTGTVNTIAISGSDLYAGGAFDNAGGNASADKIALFQLDDTAPTVNSFTATSPTNSLTIPVTAFTASDNVGMTGYKITQSSTPPSASASGWTASAPTTYTVASSGSYVLYPWVKDAMGNVSAVYGAPVSVDVDVIKPTVNSFAATSPSNSFNIPITAFTASDNFGVTGYKITVSSTPPSAGAAGWSASAPTSFTVASNGNYTLYPWAKDAVGNVSAVYGSPLSVTVDKNAPAVTYFSVPASSTNLTISLTAFTASDNVGVTGYKVTEDSTSPAASDSGWVASVPTTYTVMGDGDYTLYPWAKDAAGNISPVYGSPINVHVDTSTPTVNSFSAPSSSKSLTISIATFTVTDNVAVTGYKITTSTTPPAASDSDWTALVPTTYTVVDNGAYTLFPWVKDAAGNISPVYGSPASVTVDATAPTVISFSVPSLSKSLAIPITELTATDNVAVTGYKITTSATPPAPGAAGWTGSAPTTYTVGSSGNYTLYPWAKDAVGNVSPVDEAPYSVTVDTVKPTVNSFTASSPSASLNISITAFTASDNVAVTSYLITESATQPASNDSSWSASAPTTYTVASDGNYTLYPWAKDAAGNVSSIYGSPALVEVNTSLPGDTTAPSIDTFTTVSTSSSLDIPITSFTASDNVAVTSYLITESATQPASSDSGWTDSAPTTYTVANDGAYTLYPWAMDAVGHVSAVYGSPASVEVNIPLLIVTNTNDNGPGSLRDTIANAASGDTITFAPALSAGTIHLASTLTISKNLTIDGSALTSQITISGDSDNDGTGDVQVFSISNGATVTLNSLTITKGSNSTAAGIFNASGATLTITNSTLTDNATTGGPGGGVQNDGTLTVTNSTFSNNSASNGSGGGIRNIGTLTVANSTFSNNTTTGSGGGIYNVSGFVSLTITNSTFSGNSAGSQGGGIYYSGGVLNYANTIIANSVSGGDCAGDGTINTNTNNLVEDGSCSAALNGDPNLGPLADNGGSTQTIALLPGSAAINAGDDSVCAAAPVSDLDQRGLTRPQGAHCDIGAYEYHTVAPSVDSFTTSSWQGYSMSIATFTASDNVAVTGYLITESSTPPSPNDAGWSASAPAYYTFTSEGTYTLYPWVKDADGNISAVYGSPATVVLSFISPYIMDITRYSHNNEITNADTLDFAIHFYGLVKNIDPSDFVVTGGTTAMVTNVSSQIGASVRVTVSGGDLASFNGTVGLDISPSQDIVSDYTGKHLVASVPNPNETYTVKNERILNSGFNTYPAGKKIPTSWKAVKFSSTDGKNTTVKKEGTASLKITGTGVTKTLSQTLMLNGSSGDTFTFSFWVKGSAIPSAGICRGQVLLYNGSTLTQTKTINCATATYGFQKKTITFNASAAYTKVVIKFTYTKASGQIWFDAVSLIK